ncbi:hypothetical protein [Nocardia amamiensis]|uniref:hypothetical protein n=1 Tax=Nocardia amamiensis TaxID=404578 RepID=UPI0008341FB2|nr:hypothetical protein [Nocardia amamiensis]
MQLSDIIINKDGDLVTIADLLASIGMHDCWRVDQPAGPDSHHLRSDGIAPTGEPQLEESVVGSVNHDKIDAITATLGQVQEKIQTVLEHLDADPYAGRHRKP